MTSDDPGPDQVERVVIAVLTYRRPVDLQSLLPQLVDQIRSVRSTTRTASIMIVDNDPDRSAESIVAAAAVEHDDVSIDYKPEPTPGISAARNRALDAAAAFDVLVFIDDDERPTDRWLALLLEARSRYGAQVVQGPVRSEFEAPLDPWIEQGGFFARRRMPTGTPLDVAVTNNLLLELEPVRRLRLRFDLALGTTGGEDTLFTRVLHRAGVPMVWCNEAFVVDIVPAHRATRRWVSQRAISTGNSTSLVALKLSGTTPARLATRARLSVRGGARLIGGGLRIGASQIARSEAGKARGARTALRGFGMTLGALGFAYHEYSRDGRRITLQTKDPGQSAASMPPQQLVGERS
ncbi:glycosyltransferase [Microlunatus elymi]|uniref:Glycosyltransferase n=1 Tax=Microlunatus elymi TaxID=2596828 RepID=A0A516PVF6_9ACTN|nr:glycosyltransferase [Microlunatus elymi]QDP95175.1 glycosyltransferase [Microlunatus elymi]